MGQLPTYILFENNAEINRFPAFGFEEKFSHPHITKVFHVGKVHLMFNFFLLALSLVPSSGIPYTTLNIFSLEVHQSGISWDRQSFGWKTWAWSKT